MGITGTFGVAGSGLQNQNFALNSGTASVGARFESRTAKILNEFSNKCAVLHDVRIPLPGVKANIDHIVLSGTQMLLIDTKAWSKGFYWTAPKLGTFHGIRPANHIDKSLSMAHKAFSDLLPPEGTVPKPVIAVWGSDGDVTVKAVRVEGSTVINAHDLRKVVSRFISKTSADSADPILFESIKPYVVKF